MFGKRLELCTVFGIRIGVDLSWFIIAILLSWTLAAGYFPASYPNLTHQAYWIMGILGMLGLFLCILLHELGHAFTARYYGMTISRITLFIFGGVAEITKEPPSPKVEFLVSIAGPIVSILLAGCMYLLTMCGHALDWSIIFIAITSYLALINIVVVLFNMIPAFPLDGGRVLRSLLWYWKNNLQWATKVVAAIGSSFGIMLIIFGLFLFLIGDFVDGLWLVIIGMFINGAAASSETQSIVTREFRGEKVERFMTKDPIFCPPTISLTDLIENYVYKSQHHLYPVVDGDKLVGYISLKEIKAHPHDAWPKTSVRDAMVPREHFRSVDPQSSALSALELIQQAHASCLLVTEGEKLVGLVTARDLFKLISLKLELEE